MLGNKGTCNADLDTIQDRIGPVMTCIDTLRSRSYFAKMRLFYWRNVLKSLITEVESHRTVGISFELSGTEMAEVNRALESHPSTVLVDRFRIELTQWKFASLAGGGWLESDAINIFFQVIMSLNDTQLHPPVYCCSTFFYTKLMESGSYTYRNVARWTRRVRLDTFSKILIPINLSNTHWILGVIDLIQGKVCGYDSNGGRSVSVIEPLRRYLADEVSNKSLTISSNVSQWPLEMVSGIPQQNNCNDCGVFTSAFALHLALEMPFTFSAQDMPSIRQWMMAVVLGKPILGPS